MANDEPTRPGTEDEADSTAAPTPSSTDRRWADAHRRLRPRGRPRRPVEQKGAAAHQKQKKLLKDNHRALDSWERYRALTDVLDEALELVDLADHKARFALIIMTAINAVIFLVGTRTELIREIPAAVRPILLIGFVLYVITAMYFFFQAIESLRPRKSQPHVRYEGADGLGDHPMGIRFYEDILSRDVEAYRRAWREIKIGQLNAELAVQAMHWPRSTRPVQRAP
jgi:hypothetical protein